MASNILKNAAECLKCGEEVESLDRHHFNCCSCGNICVDGGRDYIRRVYKEEGQWVDRSEHRKETTEENK